MFINTVLNVATVLCNGGVLQKGETICVLDKSRLRIGTCFGNQSTTYTILKDSQIYTQAGNFGLLNKDCSTTILDKTSAFTLTNDEEIPKAIIRKGTILYFGTEQGAVGMDITVTVLKEQLRWNVQNDELYDQSDKMVECSCNIIIGTFQVRMGDIELPFVKRETYVLTANKTPVNFVVNQEGVTYRDVLNV